jgi:pimeloyl-ACP methyl ester carboxylesterase
MQNLPRKQVTTLNGRLFEYTISGAGRPTLVLMAGSGGPIESWFKVMASFETLGTVFAYNRPGVGGSDKPGAPETGLRVVETLRRLLMHAGLTPPYVLVGHSIGGLYANLFARKYADETAGAVFLDAAAPEDVVVMAQRKGALQRAVERAANAVAPVDEFAETGHTAETAAQIESAAPFPDIPLAVITGAKPALAWLTPREVLAARMSHQKKLAALSPRGLQILAPESGHFPQLSEPHIVIDAVRSVVWSIPGLRGRQ